MCAANVLQMHCMCAASVLQTCCRCTACAASVLQMCCRYAASVLLVCCMCAANMLQMCCRCTTDVLLVCRMCAASSLYTQSVKTYEQIYRSGADVLLVCFKHTAAHNLYPCTYVHFYIYVLKYISYLFYSHMRKHTTAMCVEHHLEGKMFSQNTRRLMEMESEKKAVIHHHHHLPKSKE